MRLVFSNADEETIDRYRDLLPRAAASWAARRPGAPVSRRALGAVAGYKLGEAVCGGDGLVARWTPADVRELLGHWVPTREALPATDSRAVPGALRTWWAFLVERGWLDPRSAPVTDFEQALLDAAPHHASPPAGVACCETDPAARGGTAGVAASVGGGAEPAPPAAAPRRGLGFAAVAAAVRRGRDAPLPASPPTVRGRHGRSLPPAALPTARELADAVAAAPVCAGRPGDRPRPAPDDALERWWSRFTGVRRSAAGRLLGAEPTACGPEQEPAADALIAAVLTALSLGRERGAAASLAPRMAAHLFGSPVAAPPATGAAAVEPSASAAGIIAAAHPLLDELAELGALVRVPDPVSGAQRHAVLTPLGWWLWFALLTCGGVRPITRAELMAEDAEVLIDRAAGGDPFGERELRQWIEARGPAAALPDLVEVYRRSDDCVHRTLVKTVTSSYALQARAGYESLRTDPAFGGRARSWLFDAGFAKHTALHPQDHLDPLLDGLAASLRTGTYGRTEAETEGGGDALCGVSEQRLPAVFDTAAASGHPEAPFVLRWFSRHHPDLRIRAAARSALARHRARARPRR
ncbi:hypothetical protein [Streptomonospora alba]|nr:hypothetical protein [Streptomonospora alba]